MLTHWFGSVSPPNNGTLTGTLSQYTPAGCAGGAPCQLIVALHGCLTSQELIGDTFADDSYLNQYADTSRLVVLYPQALATLVLLRPPGCVSRLAT